jgi:aminoglycoside phosphotransferase
MTATRPGGAGALLAPDPAVPHRDALLAGRALADEPAERVYAKYRVGESLRVVHRTRDGHYVAARSFPSGESELAYRRALAAAVPVGPRPPIRHVPELDAVLWAFPNDRRLLRLPLLATPSPALDALVGHPVTPRLVAYCAERSATAGCIDEHGRICAYAKVHVGDGAERERERLEQAGADVGPDDPHLRVPRVIGAADGALAVEAVPGRRLDTLAAAELPAALERLGAALAALHERAAVPERRFERLDVERLAKAVGVIARARPDVATAAARLLTALLEHRGDAAGPPVCLHGDPGLRNAVLHDGRVALIDFEDASAGPAAADLGRVVAALGRAPAQPLLRGYATVREPPEPRALRWHTAASVLVRSALPAVSRVRPPVLQRLERLLAEAWS